MIKRGLAKHGIILNVFVIIVLCLSLEGCSSLGKKFIRKKKDITEEEVIPVLNPVDYPAPQWTSKDRYQQFYEMFKIWQKDALVALDDRPSDKQIRYKFSQMAVQLEGMKGLLQGKSLEILNEVVLDHQAITAIYEEPAAFRSTITTKNRVKKLGDRVISELDPELVKEDLID
ncbi:MAG TPA: hypothetical protein P5160_09410 [Candidatus Omnitrophota bacterium]|jgi:hypothetical protein|nr:hypothetical protein [Candidatus Omnitrophota bacterium]